MPNSSNARSGNSKARQNTQTAEPGPTDRTPPAQLEPPIILEYFGLSYGWVPSAPFLFSNHFTHAIPPPTPPPEPKPAKPDDYAFFCYRPGMTFNDLLREAMVQEQGYRFTEDEFECRLKIEKSGEAVYAKGTPGDLECILEAWDYRWGFPAFDKISKV